MSGYKNQVIYDGARSFWTFDGDLYDSNTRVLLVPVGHPMYIIDEIENQNPAILHVQSTSGPQGYRMGMPSRVDMELADQASIAFGFYGRQPAHPDEGWAKAYIEVPHSIAYAFPNFGSFSIELMFNKKNEQEYSDWWHSLYEGYYAIPIYRPLLKKPGMIDVHFMFYYSSMLIFTFPSGNVTEIDFGPYFNRNTHLVVTWDVQETSPNIFTATESVIIDSVVKYTQSIVYYDIHPTTNVATSWEIGGMSSPHEYHGDRNTSALYIDQFAVYDYALSPEIAANHYKKLREYDKMITWDRAELFYPMDESDSLIDWTLHEPAYKSQHGGIITQYVGSLNTISRGLSGPPQIPQAIAPNFRLNSFAFMKYHTVYGGNQPVYGTSGNYTVECWFNTSHAERGVMISMQGEEYPFSGTLVTMNWKDSAVKNGSIQWNVNANEYICSLEYDELNNPYYFNDGEWHYMTLVKRDNKIELWLDGIRHAVALSGSNPVGASGCLYLMGMKPGHLNVNGKMCKFSYYGFALQPQQIEIRYTYSITYRIKGIVTLRGVPTAATIRVYKNTTGELLQEIVSDYDTGEYTVILSSNAKIDLLIFDRNDRSVRYRAYGPIIPSEYEDLPILI